MLLLKNSLHLRIIVQKLEAKTWGWTFVKLTDEIASVAAYIWSEKHHLYCNHSRDFQLYPLCTHMFSFCKCHICYHYKNVYHGEFTAAFGIEN